MKEQLENQVAPTAEVDVLDQIIHHTELPTTKISRLLDGVIERIGSLISWLWLAVIAVIIVNVIARYVFARGSIALEELTWHLFGLTFLMGLAYTLVSDHHLRVDIFHERFSLKTQAGIELAGLTLLLLLPFLYIAISVEIIRDKAKSSCHNKLKFLLLLTQPR